MSVSNKSGVKSQPGSNAAEIARAVALGGILTSTVAVFLAVICALILSRFKDPGGVAAQTGVFLLYASSFIGGLAAGKRALSFRLTTGVLLSLVLLLFLTAVKLLPVSSVALGSPVLIACVPLPVMCGVAAAGRVGLGRKKKNGKSGKRKKNRSRAKKR